MKISDLRQKVVSEFDGLCQLIDKSMTFLDSFILLTPQAMDGLPTAKRHRRRNMKRCDSCNTNLILKVQYESGNMFTCPCCDSIFFFPVYEDRYTRQFADAFAEVK
ncbi:MAG: hypothetical protein L7F77_05335 [Candidatus Magnetominusculus sp. LBB02]|nr:hypothetical protein [Candidatus Magnetominusculus sp. LBB02]